MLRTAILFLLAATSPGPRRSDGDIGNALPVGLGGMVAAQLSNCAAVNTDPRRGRVLTPIFDDCRSVVPSPSGQLVIRTAPGADETTTLRATGGLVVRSLMQPTVILWKPDSTGFLMNGGEGSGQVSNLRYFYRSAGRWTESRALDRSASALYKRRFDCRGGKDSYVNTSGWSWTSGGLLVIVQEGVHSLGCLQLHPDRSVLFEVIGDPVSGRIRSSREIKTLP